MANEHRRQVLEMLSNGTVTVEQAEALLDRVYSGASAGSGASVGSPDAPDGPSGATPSPPRYLRVLVDSEDGDRVNIRVPMALVRTGVKLTNLIPREARASVQEQGIDLDALTSLDPDELVRALSELSVDVESSSGDTVRVFCE